MPVPALAQPTSIEDDADEVRARPRHLLQGLEYPRPVRAHREEVPRRSGWREGLSPCRLTPDSRDCRPHVRRQHSGGRPRRTPGKKIATAADDPDHATSLLATGAGLCARVEVVFVFTDRDCRG
jgi:hypothetical protein